VPSRCSAHVNDEDTVRNALLLLLQSVRVRAHLVEPHPGNFARLNAGLMRHGLAGRVNALNVGVCPRTGGTLPFYTVAADRFLTEYPSAARETPWVLSELASFDRWSVYQGVPHALRILAASGAPVKNWSATAYVNTLQVRCVTPAELLRAASLPTKRLDVLVVDAEGFDADIVEAFLDSAEFRPALLWFEVHIAKYRPEYRPHLRRVLAKLVRAGYHIYCCACAGLMPGGRKPGHAEHECDIGDNAAAWDPARLQLKTLPGSGKFEWGSTWLSERRHSPGRKRGVRRRPLASHTPN